MVMRMRMRMGEMREERLRCEKGGGVFSFIRKGRQERGKHSSTREKRKQPISNKTKDGMNEVQNPHNSYGERDEERKENQRQNEREKEENERKQMNRNECHNRESRLNRNEKVSGKLVPSFDANTLLKRRSRIRVRNNFSAIF